VSPGSRVWSKGWRIAAHVSFVIAAALSLVLSGDKYDWMQEPYMDGSGVHDASGNRALFVLVLLVAVSVPELLIVIASRSWRERLVSCVLLAIAATIGWSRY